MPKVSQDHLAARRRQILDGARRCFAEFGYDGATVRRLEQAIGLSRGAIFHHFRDKDTLFFELAHEDAERMADVASREGLVQVMRDMLAAPEQFDWLATRLEIARKLRHDPAFNKEWTEALSGVGGGDDRAAASAEVRPGGCATTSPATCCSATWTWFSTGWWPRWLPVKTLSCSPLSSIWSRARCGSARPARGQRARVRWLGPPRLRIVVPDSRSMLWIDPYDLPVDATSVRMLAPPS